MIKILAIFISCFGTTTLVLSQTSQQPLSEIQSFMAQPDKCIKNNFIDVGSLKNIVVQLVKSTNVTDNKSFNGIRLEYKVPSSIEMQFGFIDIDEINGLTKTMDDLKTNVFNKPPQADNNLEYYYTSRSGLMIGGFSAFFAGTYGKMTWNEFIILDGVKHEKIIISSEEFDALRATLSQAKTQLK